MRIWEDAMSVPDFNSQVNVVVMGECSVSRLKEIVGVRPGYEFIFCNPIEKATCRKAKRLMSRLIATESWRIGPLVSFELLALVDHAEHIGITTELLKTKLSVV